MTPVIFIHTNDQQLLAAQVSAWSLKSRSPHANRFEVRILHLDNMPELCARLEGRRCRYLGEIQTWHQEDLQSFALLRMMGPYLMAYDGRALVLDPDIFAVQDVWELLDRDMQGHAVLCRLRGRAEARRFSSSVMLLDCARLRHWRFHEDLESVFAMQRDLFWWLALQGESQVGALEEYWNDFDHLDQHTRLLHNTEQLTQPWRTGLPGGIGPEHRMCRPHPDPRQEHFFFVLLAQALHAGAMSEAFVRAEIAGQRVRPDLLERVREVSAAALTSPLEE